MGAGKGQARRAQQKHAQRSRSEEPYGALSQEWLNHHIQKNGPYAYHILYRKNLEAVLRDGLQIGRAHV